MLSLFYLKVLCYNDGNILEKRFFMAKHKGLSFYQRKKKISPALIKEIFSWIIGISIMIFFAFIAVSAVGMKTSVIGVSMEPSLYNGQEILVNKFVYVVSSPKRGDLVVFLPNGNENSHYYIKRVVALPGETVEIRDGKLYVDGVLSQYTDHYDKIADAGIAENKVILSKNEYFVLGDNCNNSEDSRSGNIGAVKKETIVGKAWFHMATGSAGMGFIKKWE
jgi:signal peptidase I